MQWTFRTQDTYVYADETADFTPESRGIPPLSAPAGTSVGGTLLIREIAGGRLRVRLTGTGCMEGACYRLIDVPVEYNTADEEIYGAHVFAEPPAEKPAHCARRAPFRVYEALLPLEADGLDAPDGKAAVYLSFDLPSDIPAGVHRLNLLLADAAGETALPIDINARPVQVPTEEHLSVTNWFSLENMASRHNLPLFGEAHLAMIRRYARLMRRARQTHFFLSADLVEYTGPVPGSYRFERLKTVMDIFWEEGFSTMEFGYFGTRGHIADGTLRCPFAPAVGIDTPEGFRLSETFICALAAFLGREGAADKTIFHIADEPDVPADCIPERRPGYLMVSCLLRRHLPGARVVEAVKSTAFRGGIDIYVPLSHTYEQEQEEFDRMKGLGAEIWYYVCCCPGAGYMNRLLDRPLLDSRLLFWAAFRYGLTGYLHWGFNQYEEGQDPFVCTCPPHAYGNGALLPAGDGFMVYPLGGDVLSSVRLEAQRRGACDYELLRMLAQRNPDKARELAERAVHSFNDFVSKPEAFAAIYGELLEALEKTGI